MASAGRVLVYGGKGALGSTIVKQLKADNYWVASIDLHSNADADVNITITPTESWTDQETAVVAHVLEHVGTEKLDAILCVAGGWAGGGVESKTFVKNADLMWKQSVWTSCIAANLATKHLKEGGLLTLPGAHPCLGPTPGMLGYGIAKAAVHHLTKCLAADNSGMPSSTTVVATLPVTLDTPMNRKGMPNADFTSWTSLEYVAQLLLGWIKGTERPANGSLVQIITKAGETHLEMA